MLRAERTDIFLFVGLLPLVTFWWYCTLVENDAKIEFPLKCLSTIYLCCSPHLYTTGSKSEGHCSIPSHPRVCTANHCKFAIN